MHECPHSISEFDKTYTDAVISIIPYKKTLAEKIAQKHKKQTLYVIQLKSICMKGVFDFYKNA